MHQRRQAARSPPVSRAAPRLELVSKPVVRGAGQHRLGRNTVRACWLTACVRVRVRVRVRACSTTQEEYDRVVDEYLADPHKFVPAKKKRIPRKDL
mgnify:CR=1 FL=1